MSPTNFGALPISQIAHHASSPKNVKQTSEPPKRLRSAFIMFSAVKHKQIRAELTMQGISEKTTNVAKLVSQAWKGLAPEEKKIWEDKAQEDKARYQAEKASFKGSLKVKRRKDPNAPKRPMSAYLAFSNSRRAIATKEHPLATNSEISKILSKLWKEAPLDIKQQYIDQEAALREQYKIAMAQWKKVEKETKRNTRRLAAAEAKKVERDANEVTVQNTQYHEALSPVPHTPNAFTGSTNASNIQYVLMAAAASEAEASNHTGNIGDSGLAHGTSNSVATQNPMHVFAAAQPMQSALPSQYRSPLTELLAGRDPANAHSQLLNHFASAAAAQNTTTQNSSLQGSSSQQDQRQSIPHGHSQNLNTQNGFSQNIYPQNFFYNNNVMNYNAMTAAPDNTSVPAPYASPNPNSSNVGNESINGRINANSQNTGQGDFAMANQFGYYGNFIGGNNNNTNSGSYSADNSGMF